MYSYVFGARKKPNVATTIRHRHPIVDVTKKKEKNKISVIYGIRLLIQRHWNPFIPCVSEQPKRDCVRNGRHRRVIVKRLRNIIIYYIRASHCDIPHPQSGFMRVSSSRHQKNMIENARFIANIHIYCVYNASENHTNLFKFVVSYLCVCVWERMKIEIGRACDPSYSPPQVGGFGFPIQNQISGNGPVNDLWNAHKSSTPWQVHSR